MNIEEEIKVNNLKRKGYLFINESIINNIVILFKGYDYRGKYILKDDNASNIQYVLNLIDSNFKYIGNGFHCLSFIIYFYKNKPIEEYTFYIVNNLASSKLIETTIALYFKEKMDGIIKLFYEKMMIVYQDCKSEVTDYFLKEYDQNKCYYDVIKHRQEKIRTGILLPNDKFIIEFKNMFKNFSNYYYNFDPYFLDGFKISSFNNGVYILSLNCYFINTMIDLYFNSLLDINDYLINVKSLKNKFIYKKTLEYITDGVLYQFNNFLKSYDLNSIPEGLNLEIK